MALTGLFLCTFLIGHLLGNLQLIISTGEEGKQAFNEYAYFMTHNIFIKVLSYVTYASILFHAVDGIYLAIQNKKARPISYAYNKPSANSSTASRYMAILGSAILIFIVLHMSVFWGKMHFGDMPLHKIERITEQERLNSVGAQETVSDTTEYYLTLKGDFLPTFIFDEGEDGKSTASIKNQTEFVDNTRDISFASGYKDLHSVTLAYFGHDKTKEAGVPANKYAMLATILYVLAMVVLAFHLWHGFAAAFQSLGLKNKKYTPLISGFGKVFAVVIPLAFAIIPVILFLTK
jgi:succinate dehydrogenase / fumarate reductase cytochrome b subunit